MATEADSPGHRAFQTVRRGDGGRQQAGLAQAVHGPMSTDFVGQRKAQRKPPSGGGHVPMAPPIPGPFSPQADGGGLRAEFAGHLFGLAQDLKSRKGLFRRLKLWGAVPSRHGLDAGHQDACAVTASATTRASGSVGKCHCSEVLRWAEAVCTRPPQADGPNQKSNPSPRRIRPPKIHDGELGLGLADLPVFGIWPEQARPEWFQCRRPVQEDHKLSCRIQSKPSAVGQICQQHKEQGVQPNDA